MANERLLVCIDGSPASTWALDTALRQMDVAADELVLLTVVELYGAGYGYSAWLQDEQARTEQQRRRSLRAAAAQAKRAGVRHLKLNITYGSDVGAAIVNFVEKRPVDRLYIGRRAVSGLERWMLGSVSRHLTENAPCTVTVVKQPVAAEQTPDVDHHWQARQHTIVELPHDDDDETSK